MSKKSRNRKSNKHKKNKGISESKKEIYFDRKLNPINIGDYKSAIESFDKAIQWYKHNKQEELCAYTYINKGITQMASGDHKSAIESFDKAIQWCKGNKQGELYAYAFMNKGEAQGNSRDYRSAIESFNEAIQWYEKNNQEEQECAKAYVGKGGLQYELGDYKSSIENLDKAIQWYEKNNKGEELADAYVGKGLSQGEFGDYKSSIENLDKAIQWYEKNDTRDKLAHTYVGKGTVQGNAGDYKSAIENFDKAIQWYEKNGETEEYAFTYIRKGDAQGDISDYKSAIESFNQAIQWYEKNNEIQNYAYAYSYAKKGMFQGICKENNVAISSLDEAIKIFEEESIDKLIALQAKGNILFKLSNMNKDKIDELQKTYWDTIKIAKKIDKDGWKQFLNINSPMLREFFNYLKEEDEKKKAEKEDAKSKLLYHYTNIQGLEGILSNKEFWVTKSEFLNDSMETIYITEVIDEMIDKDSNDKLNSILEGIKNQLDKIKETKSEGEETEETKGMYILSMTPNPDSLALWGNYTNFEGYNLIFDRDRLINKLKKLEFIYNLYYGKVLYGKDMNEKLKEIIRRFYESAKAIDENLVKDALKSNLKVISLFIKHKAFECEEEYRFAFICKDGLQEKQVIKPKIDKAELKPEEFKMKVTSSEDLLNFRIGYGTLIPYIKVKINNDQGDSCLEGITVGPTNKKELTKLGLKYFLKHNNFDLSQVKIEESDIPLR